MWRSISWVPFLLVLFLACAGDDEPSASPGASGSAGSPEGGATDGGADSGGAAGRPGDAGGTADAGSGAAPEQGGAGGSDGAAGGSGGAGGGEMVPVSGLCSETDEAACFEMDQACLGSAGDCVDPAQLATCEEADGLAPRDAEGPLLGARSFVSRDDVSDALCQIGVDAALLPAGSTFAHVLRIQFRDAEGDGLTAPISSSELSTRVELVANIGEVEDLNFGSGLEAGGASGFFNITLCLDQSYGVGELTFAVRIPDDGGHMSNPLCVTYEGGMNGSRD